MKTATISEIRRELKEQPSEKIIELLLRLARFKKDNKELIDFVLYESNDLTGYIQAAVEEIDEDFLNLNTTSVFLAKKTIRKVVRKVDKWAKYSGDPVVAVELNIHFVKSFSNSGLAIKKHKVLLNIYNRRMDIIEKSLSKMHSDIQFDYEEQVKHIALH